MTQGDAAAAPSGGRESRLWRAVASLAEAPPSAEASRSQPPQAGFGENLVFEFDEAYTTYVEGFAELPTEAQLAALQSVDTKVSSMVRAADASLWTDDARREDPSWREVRDLAERVLEVFGWPAADPS